MGSLSENTKINLKNILEKKIDELLSYYEEEHFKLHGPDPFGLVPKNFAKGLRLLLPIYQDYFRVHTFNAENIPEGPVMIVANHSGQLPFDGMMLALSFFLHAPKPIIPRSMADRFLMKLPFLGKLAAETGAILGDRKNCHYILKKQESTLIFPEGIRGISKNTTQFYHLKPFSHGFARLSLAHKMTILPVSIVGAEESYPLVLQLPMLAKLLNIPSFPLTPLFPLAGPLGMIPLPAPMDIYFGKPVKLPEDLHPDVADDELKPYVFNIQENIQQQIREGRKNKRPIFDDELKVNALKYYNLLKNRSGLVMNFLAREKK